MMSPERNARLREICLDIQLDMEADTQRREGQPFTGRNVAEALGEICGTIAGLAAVVQAMLEELE